ncbi:MAG TPA: J domain-containing protein [Verrucomicrobiae bacterium]|jgi:curved DNA-binding protein
MPVEFKDYYKTLGVARTASHDEIRAAFRKLARQHHPDVAKDKKRAEEKFKEINEAYEVLGDKEKREKYDQLGADWKDGGARAQRGPGREAFRSYSSRGGQGAENYEFGGTGFSDFFEQFFGRRGAAAREPGSERGQDAEGVIMVTLEEAMSGSIRQISVRSAGLCPQCHGTGAGAGGRSVCPACGGEGSVPITNEYKVKIPSGVRDGQKLRVSGRGEPGHGGGPPGDLYLRVRMASHPDFRVEGGDLYYELDLAPWEAALGTSVSVPTLAGPVAIKIPPATQNGHRLRVRGRGLPGRDNANGDLYVVARIHMPKEIGEREKTLWEQLARESHFNPRQT